ncbi:MAG: hypothetical protein ACYCPP_07250 [Nitrososphaerales archaeon]
MKESRDISNDEVCQQDSTLIVWPLTGSSYKRFAINMTGPYS